MDRNSPEFQDYLRVKAQLLNHVSNPKAKPPAATPVMQKKSPPQEGFCPLDSMANR